MKFHKCIKAIALRCARKNQFSDTLALVCCDFCFSNDSISYFCFLIFVRVSDLLAVNQLKTYNMFFFGS